MLAACPACARPVALARATCLYCGAPLPAALAVARAANHGAPPDDDARTLVALDFARAEPEGVARALGLLAYDAAQRVRRGGWQLLRVGAPLEADQAADLRAAGARLIELPASEARAAQAARRVIGGGWHDGRLHLREEGGAATLAPGTLLLVVQGAIARERREGEGRRRFSSVVPGSGEVLHLHPRDDPRPFEIDPQDFEFGRETRPSASPLAVLLGWCHELRADVSIDDGFRHVTPALSPALPPARSTAGAFGRAPERPRAKAPERLDNLAQFRFHSAWRAAVERRLERGETG
jgi:hypothetical protein